MSNVFLSSESGHDVLLVYFFDLVNLCNADSRSVLMDVLVKINESGNIDKDIEELLDTINWRYLIVASVAIILCNEVSNKHIDMLWEALDDGGNATPQIAATLCIIDPLFVERAEKRTENLCVIKRSKHRKAKNVSLGRRCSGIGLISLLSLLEQIPEKQEWARKEMQKEEVQEIVSPNYLKYGDICTQWMGKMKELLPLIKKEYSEMEQTRTS